MPDTPIQHMPGCGFITHLYERGDDSRERVMKHASKCYEAGVQFAFQYYTTARMLVEQLDRMLDVLVDDVMALSDEEIVAEFVEDGGDLEANTARMRAIFEKAVQQAKGMDSDP